MTRDQITAARQQAKEKITQRRGEKVREREMCDFFDKLRENDSELENFYENINTVDQLAEKIEKIWFGE